MLSNCCTQHVSKFGRPSSGHRTGKCRASSQFPRRVVKNVQTIGQLHSSPMLVTSCLKSCMLGFSITWIKNLQTSELGLEKSEDPETNCHSLDHRESKGIPENIYLCFIDHVKAFDCVDHRNCGKLLKRWEYQTILLVSWETCIWVKKQNHVWSNRLVQDWERSMTELSAVTLLI